MGRCATLVAVSLGGSHAASAASLGACEDLRNGQTVRVPIKGQPQLQSALVLEAGNGRVTLRILGNSAAAGSKITMGCQTEPQADGTAKEARKPGPNTKNTGGDDDIALRPEQKVQVDLLNILFEFNDFAEELAKLRVKQDMTKEIAKAREFSRRLDDVKAQLEKLPRSVVASDWDSYNKLRERCNTALEVSQQIHSEYHGYVSNRGGVKEIVRLEMRGEVYSVRCNSGYWDTSDRTHFGKFCGSASSGKHDCFDQIASLADHVCR